MKRFILLFSLVLSLALLKAQDTYSFRTDAPQGLSVRSSTASHLSLHYSIQELGIANIENGDVNGQEIILKGQFAPNAEGHPNLPVVNRYVAVPQGATVSLQVRENASTTIDDIDLLPAMPLRTDLAEGPIQLRWEPDIFGKDANFPTENFVLSTPTQIRSLDVVMLSITPFRYNPMRKTLEVIYDIDIDISFEGGNGKFGESRYFNPDWEHILHDLVINDEMIPTTDYYSLVKEVRERDEDGWEYLIISPDNEDILAWADTLKAFRIKQGISTKVATLTECGGNNADNIRNYILNAYNNWAIPPAAVLIFGGWCNGEGIRPFYHAIFSDSIYTSSTYPTDYPYCDMNGDSLADMALSRITARNLDEYRIFVEKTIQYESDPPTDTNYYDRPIISSGHEDNKWFLISSQIVDGFYRNKLGKHPTNLYMVHSGSIPTNDWSTAYNTEVVKNYFGPNGQNYIDETPAGLNDWKRKLDSVLLYDALNEGSFLTLYRDHSNLDGWWCPAFKSMFIEPMLYGPPTFVISISCSTHNFTASWSRCLLDAFCIKEKSGAVGGIGAATLTHTYFNDILAWGLFDCLWPDFLPDMGSDTPPEFVRPAYALAEAKHYYAYHVFLPGWWPRVEYSQMNLFGYTGETYLSLFTEVPQPMEITHKLYCTADNNEFTVTAEEGAIVCLSKDGEIIEVTQSNGQPYAFALPQTEVGNRYTITATKQNRIRYECEMSVIPSSGPYVALERDGLLVENEFGVFHNGENAHIGLKLRNHGNDMTENFSMNLSCESPYIEITQGTHQHQNLAPNQSITLNDVFRFNVADDIPDMTKVTFTIRIEDEGSDKTFSIAQNIVAPLFVIKPHITYKNEAHESVLQLVNEGITDVHVQIANEGHFNSGPYLMQFEMQAPFVTVDSCSRTFDGLEKGCTNDMVFRVNIDENEYDEAWINTIIQLSDGFRQASLDTLLSYGGFNECFDSGNFHTQGWQMTGDAPWTVTDEEFHTDGHSVKSGGITHDQSSTISLTRSTPATEIRFFNKVSSEYNYDFLHFYIDDVEMGHWSYIQNWNEKRFPVSQGIHTFTWSYTKDYSVNYGEDCAWVDDISILPAHTAIAYSGDTITACMDESVRINCNYAYDYQNIEWTTAGDGSFDDIHALHPIYTPGPNDIANGGAMLQLQADNVISPLQLVLADEINLGDEIQGDDLISPDKPICHYSIEGANGPSYLWELDPAEAGSIIGHGNAVDIIWDFRHGITEVTLSVAAEANCIQETLSKTIQINPLSVSEESQSIFSLYPNPTDGKFNLVIMQELQGKSVVEVYNVLGTRLMGKTFRNLTKGQNVTFDLQHYSPGIYIIKVCNDEGCWNQKVSIKSN
jgi:hypothetical protein